VLTWLSGQQVEVVLSVGDIVDGAGDVDRCCALLAEHGAIVVRGNHERWLLEDPFVCQPEFIAPGSLGFIAALPATRRLSTSRGDLMLCHGVGDNDRVRLHPQHQETSQAAIDALGPLLADPGLRFVVAGHTHRRMVRSFARAGGPPLIFVNPGTLHRGYPGSFAVVDLERGEVEFYEVIGMGGISWWRRPRSSRCRGDGE
jgi:predicted phosphodiesterase